ncbi:MAG: helix-turn-helix transcriptional regulator [Clostridia bacterium]|nr:helix-turn-helix transcriptional regulator [Clostridia bacterium]
MRKENNLTQHEVAKLLNVVDSCYANWEQGRTEPNISMIRNLCCIFGVTSDELLEIESVAKTDKKRIPKQPN